eukprot:XP_001695468.1 predicted protein [Chlamydomonas reinhardtii]
MCPTVQNVKGSRVAAAGARLEVGVELGIVVRRTEESDFLRIFQAAPKLVCVGVLRRSSSLWQAAFPRRGPGLPSFFRVIGLGTGEDCLV